MLPLDIITVGGFTGWIHPGGGSLLVGRAFMTDRSSLLFSFAAGIMRGRAGMLTSCVARGRGSASAWPWLTSLFAGRDGLRGAVGPDRDEVVAVVRTLVALEVVAEMAVVELEVELRELVDADADAAGR